METKNGLIETEKVWLKKKQVINLSFWAEIGAKLAKK